MLSLVSYKYHSQLIGWKSDTPWEEFQVGCKERKDVLEKNIFRLVFMRVIKKSMNLETLNVDNNIYFTMRVFCWRRKWQPTPVFLPGEFHGQRNLAGYSPQGHKEADTTERRTLLTITEKTPADVTWPNFSLASSLPWGAWTLTHFQPEPASEYCTALPDETCGRPLQISSSKHSITTVPLISPYLPLEFFF